MYGDTIKEIINIITEGQIEITVNEQEFILDSIQFVKMVVSIEKEFDIEIPEKFLLLSTMNTVSKIIDVITFVKQEGGICNEQQLY